MKLQRYSPRYTHFGHPEPDDSGEWCKAIDIETLEAENAFLHAENDRLTRLLQWEQGRLERIGTHGEGCWKWGPSHYECALRLLEGVLNGSD